MDTFEAEPTTPIRLIFMIKKPHRKEPRSSTEGLRHLIFVYNFHGEDFTAVILVYDWFALALPWLR